MDDDEAGSRQDQRTSTNLVTTAVVAVSAGISALLGTTSWFYWLPVDVRDIASLSSTADLSRIVLIPLVAVAWVLGSYVAVQASRRRRGSRPSGYPLLVSALLLLAFFLSFVVGWRALSVPYAGKSVWIGLVRTDLGQRMHAENPTLTDAQLVHASAGDVYGLWEPWSVGVAQVLVVLLFSLTLGAGTFLAVVAAHRGVRNDATGQERGEG